METKSSRLVSAALCALALITATRQAATAKGYVSSKGVTSTWFDVKTFENEVVALDARVALVVAWELTTLLDEPVVDCRGAWVVMGEARVRLKQAPDKPARVVPAAVLEQLILVDVVIRADVHPGSTGPLSLNLRCNLGAMSPPGVLPGALPHLNVAESYARERPEERFSYNRPGSPEWNDLLHDRSGPVPPERAKQALKQRVTLRMGDGASYIVLAKADLSALAAWLAELEAKEVAKAKEEAAALDKQRDDERRRRDAIPGPDFWQIPDDPQTVADKKRGEDLAVVVSHEPAVQKVVQHAASHPPRSHADSVASTKRTIDALDVKRDIAARVAARNPVVPPATTAPPAPVSSERAAIVAKLHSFAPYEGLRGGAGKYTVKLHASWAPLDMNPCYPTRKPGCSDQTLVTITAPSCTLEIDARGPGPYNIEYTVQAKLAAGSSGHRTLVDDAGIFTETSWNGRWLRGDGTYARPSTGGADTYRIPVAIAGSPRRDELQAIVDRVKALDGECQVIRARMKELYTQPDLASAEALAARSGFAVTRKARAPVRIDNPVILQGERR